MGKECGSDVSSRSFWGERFVTAQKTAAKETNSSLETWFTNLEQTPLNRCQQLSAPYKRLIHDINITNEPNRTT